MTKLIMWNLQSIDGCFDGAAPWQLDWHNTAWGPELEKLSTEQLDAAGAILFGRKTYEGMAGYSTTATGRTADRMNAIPKVVFSRTLTTADWNNTRLIADASPAAIAGLKAEAGKDLFIFGSANLSETFIERGLIDEYRICVAPIVLGEGSPLFKPSAQPMPLRLIAATPLASGAVLLRYEPTTPTPAS